MGGYAVRADGLGWRSVSGVTDIEAGEIFSDTEPTPGDSPPSPDCVLHLEGESGWCWCRGVSATLSALIAEKDRIISLGMPWEGHTYQIEEKYLGNLQWFLSALSSGITNPHKGFLRDIDNVNVPVDDAGIKDIALAASGYYRAILMAWAAHKDALAVLVAAARAAHEGDDVAAGHAANEAAEAYDVTTGWPVFSLEDKF